MKLTDKKAIEVFEGVKGETLKSQKINTYKMKWGYLVIRNVKQIMVTDKLRDEVLEIHENGKVIERNLVLCKWKR